MLSSYNMVTATFLKLIYPNKLAAAFDLITLTPIHRTPMMSSTHENIIHLKQHLFLTQKLFI